MKIYLILICVLSLSSCGGSNRNESSLPADNVKSVSLKKLNSTSAGPIFSSSLIGSETNGARYSGSILIENGALEVKNGVLTTPKKKLIIFNLVESIKNQSKIYSIDYIDASTGYIVSSEYNFPAAGPIRIYNPEAPIISCDIISSNRLPDSVVAGESGALSTLMCGDRSTLVVTWSVAYNKVNFFFTEKEVRTYGGNTLSDVEFTYTLNEIGEIQAIKREEHYSYDNSNFILSSSN